VAPFVPQPPWVQLEQWSSGCKRKRRGGVIVLPNPFFALTKKFWRTVGGHEPQS
jgi:hypothetical protein